MRIAPWPNRGAILLRRISCLANRHGHDNLPASYDSGSQFDVVGFGPNWAEEMVACA